MVLNKMQSINNLTMDRDMTDFLKKGLDAKRESKSVEFKESLDVNSPGEWCEIIKDVVAIANSGGGIIMIGIGNHGEPSSYNADPLLKFEPADITSKIHKYTGVNFEVEIIEQRKRRKKFAAMLVPTVAIPIVFSKPGTYNIGGGKQKTAFGVGTVYFRHGAKSEPGTSEDIRMAVERHLETIRKEWVRGIRKVTTAPLGSKIVVASSDVTESQSEHATPIRVTTDPKAPAYRKLNPDDTHPYRMKELLQKLNNKFKFAKPINTHDMLCVRRLFAVDVNERLCYKPNFGSQQYSDEFIQWFSDKVMKDSGFLEKCRSECHDRRFELGLTVPHKKKTAVPKS
jgi:hypothetical protein